MRNTKTLALNALIGATYAVFTIMIAPIAYSDVQLRLSEVIVFLAFYNRKFIPGLVVGCFIANLPSTLGIYDLFFGTLSTLIVCYAMNYLKNRYLAALAGGLITGVIVGGELTLAFKMPFIFSFLSVFIGEFIVLMIGAWLFGIIMKNNALKEFIEAA